MNERKMSMRIIRQEITPEIARDMLKNNPRNRKINEKRVATLVHDILNGQWTDSPTPISLNSEGELLDGQHRLMAISKSDRAVQMYVAYDVPNGTVFDKSIERKSGDALYMRGLIDKNVSGNRVISVVNRYMAICGNRSPSDTDRANFINEFGSNILKAISISKTGVTRAICDKAGCQTAIFAALNKGVSEESLRSFAKCANTGFMESPTESAAVILRNYIHENKLVGSTAADALTAYTQMCIRDYVANTPRRQKYKNLTHVYIKE